MEARAGGEAPRWWQRQGRAACGRRRWRPVEWGGAGACYSGGGWRTERRIDPGPGRADPPLDRPAGVADPARSHWPPAARRGTGSEGLVTSALWVLIALQGPASDLQARVDRIRLAAGELLTLTVRARTRTAEPVSLTLPPLTGFAIVGSREVTEVSVEGALGQTRTTTRELRLRAERAGARVIGPVRARQGRRTVATEPIAVTVDSVAAGPAASLSPVARGLIAAAAPPAQSDRVALSVILPGGTALAGAQLDVVAAAWFPRELRTRLRRMPILTLQTPEGVWSYPGASPSAPAASRLVRGGWMDLFVAHQVVFPLAAGRVIIPPATVDYAVPVNFSFFSREERYSLKSDSVVVTVLPLPASRIADGPRVVAQGLALELAIEPAESRVGEPLEVSATVSGLGNVALWPEPVMRWPAGFRAYPGEATVRVEPRGGRMAGSKTFHYLVVPDSVGSFLLPEIRYAYYDFAAGDYTAARAPPRALAVAQGAEPRAARPLPPLDRSASTTWSTALAAGLMPWGWVVLLVGPPLLAWFGRRRLAPRRATAAEEPGATPLSRLGRLEHAFHALLASHVPDPVARDGDGLARALRAAGVESAVADHVMRLRDRLRAARYGPPGLGDGAELAAELAQVLKVLDAEPAGGRGRRWLVAVCVGAFVGAAPPPGLAVAQAPNAEALYDIGALRAAADSFAARAAARPEVAAHWYNLGATLYRAGADGKAAAAWAIAARLTPRAPLVLRARRFLPPPDAASEPLLATGLATPGEWALGAAAGWVGLWLAVAARRRGIALLLLALATAACGGLALREWRHRAWPVAVIASAGA